MLLFDRRFMPFPAPSDFVAFSLTVTWLLDTQSPTLM